MDVGIGLPTTLSGVKGPEVIEWARVAEQAGFSVLGTIGRVVYDNHEELIALAAAAGATERIALMPTVLVAPPRQAVLLAKQAATLQVISGGRFRLGMGIGGRDDDWAVLGVEPVHRGDRLEALVAECRRLWAGDAPPGAARGIGPKPGHLPIVLGGFSEPAFERAGRVADGFLAGPMPPEGVAWAFSIVKEAAAAAGRPTPALYASRYVALGDAVDEGLRNLADYYSFGGPDTVAAIQGSMLRTEAEVAETLAALRDAGADEVVLWPTAASLSQVERIAAAAGL